jgi:cytochrome c oxidase subunit 2
VTSLTQLAGQSIPSTLSPQGPAAVHIASLWWITAVACGAVFLLVMVLLLVPIARELRRKRNEPEAFDIIEPGIRTAPPVSEARWIGAGGAAMPVVVLTTLFLATLITMRSMEAPAAAAGLTIEVVGHQWWWEVRYPGRGVVTANELHLPVGKPARISLRGVDVIHSLWVPQLNGKTDLIPGQHNSTWLQADHPGHYLGMCAEFCGPQHAHMAIEVIAEDSAAFDGWMAHQRMNAAASTESADGARVFQDRGCGSCHSVRGTAAAGTIGPDLTHVASRAMLAAGALPNHEGDVAGWIANPGAVKPGTLMPRIPMPGAELRAVARYLESLK